MELPSTERRNTGISMFGKIREFRLGHAEIELSVKHPSESVMDAERPRLETHTHHYTPKL